MNPVRGSDVKVDPDRTWFKSTTLWGALILAVTGTLLYARMESAISTIQKTIESDAVLHEKDRVAIVAAIDKTNATMIEMRDELRKLVGENVSIRQSSAWLELFQVTVQAWVDRLRADNPSLKVPDLKVPALPR